MPSRDYIAEKGKLNNNFNIKIDLFILYKQTIWEEYLTLKFKK